MVFQSWYPYMGLNRYPSATNQEPDAAILSIVQYSDKRVDRGIIVEADRYVEPCLLEFPETNRVRIFHRNAVVSNNGYLGLYLKREQ